MNTAQQHANAAEHNLKEIMEKAYLNKADILERLKISGKTLDRWMKKGEIPYIKLGYVIRFDWEKVQEAFEKNERKATF